MKIRTRFLFALLLAAALALPAGAAEDLPVYDILIEPKENSTPAPNAALEEPAAPPESGGDADAGYDPAQTTPDEDGRFSTVHALFSYWESAGYPDTVGGVWVIDGDPARMAIAVVDGDKTAIADIRAQLTDPGAVFTSCRWSHNELMDVLDEITAEMIAGESYAIEAGIGNRGDDFTLNGEPCVGMTVSTVHDEAAARAYADDLVERYGDMVSIKIGPFINMTTPEYIGPNPLLPAAETPAPSPWLILLLIPAALLGFLFLLRRRAVLVTAGGRTVEAGTPCTRRRAEQAVRESAVRPDRDNWEAIRRKLDF